jgi:hypothetical protein
MLLGGAYSSQPTSLFHQSQIRINDFWLALKSVMTRSDAESHPSIRNRLHDSANGLFDLFFTAFSPHDLSRMLY